MHTALTLNDLNLNDIVKLTPYVGNARQQATTYKVVRKLSVNVELLPIQGGRLMRVAPDLLIKVDSETASAAVAAVVDLPAVEVFHLGEIVRVSRGKYADGGRLYVVLGETPKGYKIAWLGGNNGRYVNGMPAGYLERIDLADVVR